MRKIGQNVNVNDEAFMSLGIAVGVTSVPIATTHKETLRLTVTNAGNKDVFIKLQAASVDDDLKGFLLYKGTAADIILAPNVYVGEVSAIALLGTTTIFTVNY